MSDAGEHPLSPLPDIRKPLAEHPGGGRGKVFRRLTWIGICLVVVLIVLSAWTVLRSGPAAYTLLQISRQPQWFLFPQGKEEQAAQAFEAYGMEQAALAKTRPVINAALRNPRAASMLFIREQKDPIGWLENHLEVTFDKETGFLRIALRTGQPTDRLILVESVRDAYLSEVVYKENDGKLRRLVKLKEFYLKSEDELRQKRKVMRDMAMSVGGPNEKLQEAKQKLRDASMDALQKDLISNLSDLRKAEVKLVLAQRRKEMDEAARCQVEIEYLKEMRKKLEKDFEVQAREVRDPRDKAIDLDFFQKEIDALENVTRTVATQKQQLEIELDAPARIRVIQEAVLEDSPSATGNWKGAWHDLVSWLWK